MKRVVRRLSLDLAVAGCGVLGAAAVLVTDHARDASSHEWPTVRVGQTCRSTFDFATEVSCEYLGIDDVRYNCTAVRLGPCPPTEEIVLKNVGRDTVIVESFSGPPTGGRTPHLSSPVHSGESVVVRPAAAGHLLVDIDIHVSGRAPAALKITKVA
ncbi:hypothetical protein FNH09_02335 [Streptomyces adustus]|uniref:DUF4232 domain-containing protein n=1 Tax=Streptomyces adustus TaxID=1609272 RepID=A0A5N8V4F2_9ACTN|nr:hypothetical protein [Streptomyces adustus]MPY30191.1 hypothetical protein [Streptomyces adustus]